MLVCHCHRISDREIRRCARSGAKTLKQIGDACGAGTTCGGCRPALRELLQEDAHASHEPAHGLIPALAILR